MKVTNILTWAVAPLAVLTEAAVLRTANTTAAQAAAGDPAAEGPKDVPWQTKKSGYKTQTEWHRLDPEKDYGCELTAQFLDNYFEKWQTRYHVMVHATAGDVADALFPNDPNITERSRAIQKDMIDTWVEAFFVSNDKQKFHYQKRPEARANYNYKAKEWEAESKESQYPWSWGRDQYIKNQVGAVRDWEEKTLKRCSVVKDF